MSTLPNYNGTVELAAGLRPKNNGTFPLVEAHDIMVDNNGKRLDAALEELANGGGGGGTGEAGRGIEEIESTTGGTDENGRPFIEYTIIYTDGTRQPYVVTDGKDGAKGKDGANGNDGLNGKDGKDGADGKSAYEYAQESGYKGTEAEFTEDINPDKINNFLVTELAKRGQLEPEYAESVEWLTENGDQSKMYVLPDGMIWAWKLTEKEIEIGGYTNVLPTAKATDRTTIYGGDYNGDGVNDGYLQNRRLSSSGSDAAKDGCCTTGFISAKEGDVLRMTGWQDAVGTSLYVITYKSDNTKVAHLTYWADNINGNTVAEDGFNYSDGLFEFPLTSDRFGTGFDAVRISSGSMENLIITINEEIKEGGTEIVTEYAWASTGLAFVPADYEDRINAVEKKAASNTSRIVDLENKVANGLADVLTEAEKLKKIKEWDKPVFDFSPVTLLSDDRIKPALTTADRTISAIYAKYRALMAANPRLITETNLGACTSSGTFSAVDVLRFDIKEPDGITDSANNPNNLHETKPKIIFMSGVHAEWVGVWGLYYAIEEIVTNPEFDDVRRNAHIIVVPCSNPFALSNQTVSGWATGHVNANGVAIHNNFGVDHSTSGTVGTYNYGGSAPYSELETQYIDGIMGDNPDAIAFVSCHNNDYSTEFGTPVIWASSATYHMCNVTFRLIDKLSKAWLNKYGDTLISAIDAIRADFPALQEGDYRLGRATMSTSKGTEQKNATKYGIQGVNVEIARMMKVFSGNTDGTSEVMTHGAEVYANFMRTLLTAYNYTDKQQYYI